MTHFDLKHVELSEAKEFVARLHRHLPVTGGHRFSLGCSVDGELVGVAICGRPKARMTDASTVVEITRLCTDGTKNACSFLYGAVARASRALGYSLVQTFILDSEPGTSLIAAGYAKGHVTDGGEWHRPSRSRKDAPQAGPKTRYFKVLSGVVLREAQ